MDEAALRRLLEEHLRSVREEIGSVREEIGSVRAEVGSVRAELGSVREEVGSVREEVGSVREEVGSVRAEVGSVREDLRATEERLTQSAQLHFRQMRELYQGLTERMDGIEKELGKQFAQTRGAIDALHASVQSQDFRADQLARRVTALELQEPTE